MSTRNFVRWTWRMPDWKKQSFHSNKSDKSKQCGQFEMWRNQHHRCAPRKQNDFQYFSNGLNSKRNQNDREEPVNKKCKSTRKQEKNRQRMDKYNKGRTAMQIFPFANQLNNELKECLPSISNIQIISQKKTIKDLTQHLNTAVEKQFDLATQLKDEKEKHQKLLNEKESLALSNKVLQKRQWDLKEQLDVEKEKQIQLKNELQTMLQHCEELNLKRRDIQVEHDILDFKNHQLETDLKILTKENSQLKVKSPPYFMELLPAAIEEHTMLIEFVIKEIFKDNRNYHGKKGNRCRKCYSLVQHLQCPANVLNVRCKLCNKPNHFTLCCEEIKTM